MNRSRRQGLGGHVAPELQIVRSKWEIMKAVPKSLPFPPKTKTKNRKQKTENRKQKTENSPYRGWTQVAWGPWSPSSWPKFTSIPGFSLAKSPFFTALAWK